MACENCGMRGYFNNQVLTIIKLAIELQEEIDIEKNGINIDGCILPSQRFTLKTLNRLQTLQQIIELAGKLSIEIELLYLKEQGETNFNIEIDNLINQYIELVNYTDELNKKNKDNNNNNRKTKE